MSQSLFQWKLFCNFTVEEMKNTLQSHNPYFSGNSFATKDKKNDIPFFKMSQSLFQWKLFCNLRKAGFNISVFASQSLFQWKLFCNLLMELEILDKKVSQSLFQWKLFCNNMIYDEVEGWYNVTILILVETLLQPKEAFYIN